MIVLLTLASFPEVRAAPAPADPPMKGSADLPMKGSGALRLEGLVVDPDGKPASGAALILRFATRLDPDYTVQSMTMADREGRFRFEGLPPDACEARVAAHLPGKALATHGEGIPAPLSGADRMKIVLEPGSTLRVSFRVPAGLPPAEGAVALEKEERWTPFGASEAVLTGLPVGPLGIKYHSETYGGGVFFTVMGAGQAKDTVIDLVRPDWVEGRLIDGDGSPVAGALYRAENAFRGMPSRTGGDGMFRARRSRSGPMQIHFHHPGYRDTVLAVARDAAGGARAVTAMSPRAPLELRLDKGAPAIAGKAVPAAGNPSACLVTARPQAQRKSAAGRGRWIGSELRRAVPDAAGDFALRGLDAETYRIRLDCPGSNLWEDTAAPGAVLRPISVGPAQALAGKVIAREDGAPVPRFALRVSGLRPENPEAVLQDDTLRSDSLGGFSVFPRFEGNNVVCASAAGFAPACRVLAADDSLPAVVELERGVNLKVRALAAGGTGDSAALPGSRVRVRRAGSKSPGWSGDADSSGEFRLADLARGEYVVDVREGGRMPWRRTVEISGDASVEAGLAAGAAISGTLLQWNGKAPRGLRLFAKPEWPSGAGCPAGIAESPVKPDGSFALAGLGTCPVTLGVAAAWSRSTPFLPLWRLDDVMPGGGPLEIRLPQARAWEISVVSGGLPLPVEAEIHFLLPARSDSLPGEPLGHPLGKVAFRGTYAVNAFAGTRYVIVVGARGYREGVDTVVVPPGEDAFETRIELAAWPELRGRVAGGKAGWKISGPTGVSSDLDAEGAFRLAGLPPGPSSLALRDDRGRLLWVGAGSSGNAENVITPADSIESLDGASLDQGGRPVAGAVIVIRRREAPEEVERVVTDGQGRFHLEVPAGSWLACPEDPALACTRLSPGKDSGSQARVRFIPGTRKATVMFKLPMPLPMRGSAALVGVGGAIPALETRDGEMLHGAASFRSLPEGRLDLHAAAYSPSPAALYWASGPVEGAVAEFGDAGPAIAVSASDSSGLPIKGVAVRFIPRVGVSPGRGAPGRAWGEAEGWRPPSLALFGTDATGTLRCLGVQPGRYWVYAFHPAYACAPVAWETGKAASPALALVLKPGSPIRVKVTHGGHPVAGARVEVFDTLGNRAAPAAGGQRDGDLLECGAFVPGKYQVAVAAPGLGRLVRAAEVGPGTEANLEASLPASGWLEVIGEGLEDKVFFLKDSNNKVTSLVRQAENPPLDGDGIAGGTLLFHGILPERYQVWMVGGREGLGEIEIRPGSLSVLSVGKLGRIRVALPARRG